MPPPTVGILKPLVVFYDTNANFAVEGHIFTLQPSVMKLFTRQPSVMTSLKTCITNQSKSEHSETLRY